MRFSNYVYQESAEHRSETGGSLKVQHKSNNDNNNNDDDDGHDGDDDDDNKNNNHPHSPHTQDNLTMRAFVLSTPFFI